MKKLIKSTVAVASAVAMAFTMAAVPTVSALADDTAAPAPEEFDTTAMADGEVHYTVAGGFGKVTWNPLAKDDEMKAVEGLDGVYSFTAELPAYDEAAEWNNRFKVCRIDNSIIDAGWSGSVCLGTTVAADNQSQIRILNEEAGKFTVYFDSTTGAVVVRDANDADVDLSISWVGYDDETQFMSAAEIAASTLDQWPAGKVKVDAVPALDKINAALSDKLTNMDPSTMAEGEVHYTVAGGFGVKTWNPLARKAEMTKVAGSDSLYIMKADLQAYDEAAEWNNRFKVCKIDNSIIDAGWSGSVCLGTTVAADNQSQIRILNETAGTYYILFDASTGAVAVKGTDGKFVDLSISWVGYDDETQFMSEAEIAASTLDQWPAGKVKVDSVPNLVEINDALKNSLEYDTTTMKEGETYYTIAGGFGPTTWNPLAKTNTMAATAYEGVYSYTVDLGAYDETAEWNNRFKVCRINNTIIDAGWSGSLCVGTTTYADNQSQIRILNKEAGTFIIYLDTATGAVVVKDADGNLVDLSISWVGYDDETQFMTPEEIAATTLDQWPAGKVKVDAVPNVAEINNALVEKLSKPAPAPTPEPVKPSLKIKAGKTILYTGKSTYKTTIKATVKGDSKKVTYKSSNTKVATVSSKGVVTAKKAGKVVISAKANGITKKVTITVKNPIITVKNGSKKVSSVSLKKAKSVKLSVTTSPSKAGFKATYATSASKKIVKITTSGSKVTVKGLKKGTAKVKITSGGATKTVKVTVK